MTIVFMRMWNHGIREGMKMKDSAEFKSEADFESFRLDISFKNDAGEINYYISTLPDDIRACPMGVEVKQNPRERTA